MVSLVDSRQGNVCSAGSIWQSSILQMIGSNGVEAGRNQQGHWRALARSKHWRALARSRHWQGTSTRGRWRGVGSVAGLPHIPSNATNKPRGTWASVGGLAVADRLACAANGGVLVMAANAGRFPENGGLGEPWTAAMISRKRRVRMSRGRRNWSPTNGGRFPVNCGLGEPRTEMTSMLRVEKKKGRKQKTFQNREKQTREEERHYFLFFRLVVLSRLLTGGTRRRRNSSSLYFCWTGVSQDRQECRSSTP